LPHSKEWGKEITNRFPKGKRAIGCKWAFIKRRKRNGIKKEGEKIKGWLIAKGYS
jgi:hypothetical protein